MDPLPRLLVALCEAARDAHTEATLVEAVGHCLGRHVGLRTFEHVTATDDGLAVLRHPGGERRRRPSSSSVVGGAPRASVVSCEGDTAEARDARALGGRWLLVLPLGAGGYGLAALDEAPRWLDEAACDAVARVVAAGFGQTALLARVAEVSRRAHHDRRALQDELSRHTAREGPALSSAAMRRLFDEAIPAVARHAVPVLVRGESGVGKDVVARRVHALSPRALRPFVAINCGAIPDALVESVLFGHEKGAFTGAIARHLGCFERAHGGTLQLDEVGDLSPAAQVRLLRVLQTGQYERVGGEATLRTDARVVATTHRDLAAMVAAGTFRLDLYHRLRVVELVLPPLRERPEDVAPLALHFAERAARDHGVPLRRFTEAELEGLAAQAWPGNVRELEFAVLRMTLFPGEAVAAAPARSVASAAVLSLDDVVRAHIERTLRATGGLIYGEGGAAQRLGLKPTTLQSRMKKLGVRRT